MAIKTGVLGICGIGLLLFGQADVGNPMGWIGNVTGMSLCVFIVIRFGNSLDKLTEAITQLRVHCASVQGSPDDDEGKTGRG